jgi:hypothetical protein
MAFPRDVDPTTYFFLKDVFPEGEEGPIPWKHYRNTKDGNMYRVIQVVGYVALCIKADYEVDDTDTEVYGGEFYY